MSTYRFRIVLSILGFVGGLVVLDLLNILPALSASNSAISLQPPRNILPDREARTYKNVSVMKSVAPSQPPETPRLAMYYTPPTAANISTPGTPFKVKSTLLTSLGLPFTNFTHLDMKSVGNFVLVTGASSNHFKESIDSIASVQKHMPGYTIYYYDIGLTPNHVKMVQSFCRVVYRTLQFEKYPQHVRKLGTYAFKAFIIQEMLQEFDNVLWIDASIRFVNNVASLFSQIVDSHGFLQLSKTRFSNFAVTHPGMYKYLPTLISRLKDSYQGEANSVFFSRTEFTCNNILHWWILCAADVKCMAPVGSALSCRPKKNDNMKSYANCHRYDQSALGILASNAYGYNYTLYISATKPIKVLRVPSSMYEIQTCP